MKKFQHFFDSYLNTSVHIGFAVLAFAKITQILLSIEANRTSDFVLFFGTILGYNFLKYFEVFRFRKFTVKQNSDIVLVSSISTIFFLYFFIQLETSIQINYFKSGLLVLLYPFVRKWGFIKILFVSFCITICTVYFPSESIKNFNQEYYLLFFQRIVIVISLLIPFEIRDSTTDDPHLKTVPQQIGVKNTKILGFVLLLIFSGIGFFNGDIQILGLLLNFVIAIIIALFLYFSNENRSKYYTSFWVESVPIFWWLLLVFIQ
jgi:hypothetical protein